MEAILVERIIESPTMGRIMIKHHPVLAEDPVLMRRLLSSIGHTNFCADKIPIGRSAFFHADEVLEADGYDIATVQAKAICDSDGERVNLPSQTRLYSADAKLKVSFDEQGDRRTYFALMNPLGGQSRRASEADYTTTALLNQNHERVPFALGYGVYLDQPCIRKLPDINLDLAPEIHLGLIALEDILTPDIPEDVMGFNLHGLPSRDIRRLDDITFTSYLWLVVMEEIGKQTYAMAKKGLRNPSDRGVLNLYPGEWNNSIHNHLLYSHDWGPSARLDEMTVPQAFGYLSYIFPIFFGYGARIYRALGLQKHPQFRDGPRPNYIGPDIQNSSHSYTIECGTRYLKGFFGVEIKLTYELLGIMLAVGLASQNPWQDSLRRVQPSFKAYFPQLENPAAKAQAEHVFYDLMVPRLRELAGG